MTLVHSVRSDTAQLSRSGVTRAAPNGFGVRYTPIKDMGFGAHLNSRPRYIGLELKREVGRDEIDARLAPAPSVFAALEVGLGEGLARLGDVGDEEHEVLAPLVDALVHVAGALDETVPSLVDVLAARVDRCEVGELALLDDRDELAVVAVQPGPGTGRDGDPPVGDRHRSVNLDIDDLVPIPGAELFDHHGRGGRGCLRRGGGAGRLRLGRWEDPAAGEQGAGEQPNAGGATDTEGEGLLRTAHGRTLGTPRALWGPRRRPGWLAARGAVTRHTVDSMEGGGCSYLEPGAGKLLDLGGLGVHFKVRGEQTRGAYAVVEHPIAAHTIVEPHVHRHEDELTFVLEGTLWARVGDQELELAAGFYLWKPRNILHSFWNPGSEPARILETISPAGFEHFFEELADVVQHSTSSNEEAVSELCSRYGLTFDRAWLPGIESRFGPMHMV